LPDIEWTARRCTRRGLTDRKAGTIRRLLPVTAVESRTARGRCCIRARPSCSPLAACCRCLRIEAGTLAEAAERFPAAVHVALEQAIEEAREYRREASSRIVVPDVGRRTRSPGAGRDQA